MYTISQEKIIRKDVFYKEFLEFYLCQYSMYLVDLFVPVKNEAFFELNNFSINGWFRKKLLRNHTFKVNRDNIHHFLKYQGDIEKCRAWGLLTSNKKSLIFNGYGDTVIDCYSDRECIETKILLESFVINKIIIGYEEIKDNG
jgi:hypothetical protein